MATLASVLADIATLSLADKEILKNHLLKAFPQKSLPLKAFVTEERFAGGIVCPVCGGASMTLGTDTARMAPRGMYAMIVGSLS